MFPNVRLIIAAVFASVLALSFGFGVFAAFRVNHEPLNRLPSGTAPPQFVSGAAAPVPVALAIADTVGSRFESSDAQATAVGAGLPMSPINRPGQDEAPAVASAVATRPGPITEPVAESQQAPIATSGADAPAQRSATPDAVVPPAHASNADQDGKPDAMIDNAGAVAAIEAPAATLSDQPADQARPLPREKVGQKVVHKKIVRRRTAVASRRGIRARAPAPDEINSQAYAFPQQNFSFPQRTAPQVAQQAPQLGQPQVLLQPRRSITRAVGHKAVIKKAVAVDPVARPSTQ